MQPEFELLFRLDQTQSVAPDWSVVVTDIQGSSQAIQAGKHREVNLVGASAIAAVRNLFGGKTIPYVFGGDGATFLVPPAYQKQTLEILTSVQRLAKSRLNYDLRLGTIDISSVQKMGGKLHMGFIPCGPQEGFHFFRGNGLSIAEAYIKTPTNSEPLALATEGASANLQGLSCRLDPFNTIRGTILSVLVEPRVPLEEEDAVFHEIRHALGADKPLATFKPISLNNHSRPWLARIWKQEAQLVYPSAQWKAFFENVFGTFFFKTNIRNPFLGSPSRYTESLLNQSDWIKMDGTLRMVIDVESIEEHRLQETLNRLHRSGKIFFGLASSKRCVMTCHLQSAQEDRHTHFIDGDQGGLTRAALELKQQKKPIS